jgi:hypothetical protein
MIQLGNRVRDIIAGLPGGTVGGTVKRTRFPEAAHDDNATMPIIVSQRLKERFS